MIYGHAENLHVLGDGAYPWHWGIVVGDWPVGSILRTSLNGLNSVRYCSQSRKSRPVNEGNGKVTMLFLGE